MKAILIQSVLLAIIFAVMVEGRATGQEVLWNHADATGGGLVDPDEWSEVVILEHSSKITKISMWLEAREFTPAVVDAVLVRLYTTSGIQSGVPETLLWSGVIEDINLDVAVATLFTINVPEVLVPRVFAYSTERASGLSLFRRSAVPHPAHFGQWGTRAWYEGGAWHNIGGVPFVPLAARFEGISTDVVPEPGLAVVLFSAAVGFVVLRHPRNR